MHIEHFLNGSRLGFEVMGGPGPSTETYKLADVGDVDGSDVKWTIKPGKDMPTTLKVERDVARVEWQFNFDVRIEIPAIPQWKSFILEAEYRGKRASTEIQLYKDFYGRVALGKYFQLADPAQWTSPQGQRALCLIQAMLDDYTWDLSNPLPIRAAVRLVKNPKTRQGTSASYFTYDDDGNPVVILDRSYVDNLDLTSPLTVTGQDRTFADYFLHEVGHAIMSFLCGPVSFQNRRDWLTRIRQFTGGLRSSIIGAPFSIFPGAVDWGYQLLTGLWGNDRYDFMSEWCRVSGWVIDEPEKGLGWLGWKTEPPNIFMSENSIGRDFNLRNTKATNAVRNRLLFLDSKGYVNAQNRLNQLLSQTPPNAAAVAAQQKVVDDLAAEGKSLKAKGGFVTEYAAKDPREDWAECVSQPFAYGFKIPDPARRKFLADRGLPQTKSPPDLGKWLGVTIRPVTTLKGDGTVSNPPRVSKKPRRTPAASAVGVESLETDDHEDGTGEDDFDSFWLDYLSAVHDCRAAVQELTGDTAEKVMDVIRNAESPGDFESEFGGLRLAATHGAGLVPVVDEPVTAAVGDLLFAKGNSTYITTEVNAEGLPQRLIGSHSSFSGSLPETLPTLDPKRVRYRWTPATERRVWIPTAEGEDPNQIPLNNWLWEITQWWGRDKVEIARDSESVSTGPLFARAWLKVSDQTVRLHKDPSMEEIEKTLAKAGSGLLEWHDDYSSLQPGDLIALPKDDILAVIAAVDEPAKSVELLVGGQQQKGDFGEEPGTVRLQFFREKLPARWIWRPE